MCSVLCLVHFVVMWAYPIPQTIKAIASGKGEHLWLVYWLLRGLVSFLLCNILYVVWDYMYGFYLIETIVCAWLVHPDFKGAEFISETVFPLVFHQVNELMEKTPILRFIEEAPATSASTTEAAPPAAEHEAKTE
jgi:hypothetical protein